MEENELLQNELLAGEVPEESTERTYHFIDGRAKGADSVANIMGQAESQNLTEAELKAAFEDDPMLQETFESWDNYLGYMNERQDLIDSGDYNPDWHKNDEIKSFDTTFVMPDGTRVPADQWTPDMGQPASIEEMPSATGGGVNVETEWRAEQWNDQAEMLEGVFQKYATGANPHGDRGQWTHYSEGNDGYTWNGTSWIKTWEPEEATKHLFKAAIAIGAGMIGGAGIAGMLPASTPGWMVGAVKGAVGSLVSQGAMGEGIDPQALFQSVLLAGVGGLVGDLSEMDASIFDDVTGLTGKADEVVTGLSDMLKIPYDEALKIAEGVTTGIIAGDDITSIVANAAGNYAQGEIMDALQEAYGDTVQVSDWFKDGASNIPVEALEPFVGGAIQAAINGGADAEDALRMIYDYHAAGGDLDFILPPGVDMPAGGPLDWLNAQLPDVTVDWDAPDFDITYEEGLGPEDGFEEDEKDKITIDIPGIDIDLPDVDIDIPEVKCPTGEKWSTNLSKCVPDVELPEVPEIKCPTGQKWSSDLSQCVPELDVEIPEVKCPTGQRWSSDLSQCVPELDVEIPEIKCPAGEKWSSDLSQCVPEVELPEIPEVKCPAGEKWSSDLSKCVPDVELPEIPEVKCPAGQKWSSNLSECVPEVELPEVDVEVPEVKCPTGEKWSSDLSECVPDLPDVPSLGGGSGSGYKATPQGLFSYTTLTPYQKKAIEPIVDYVAKAKGMLS